MEAFHEILARYQRFADEKLMNESGNFDLCNALQQTTLYATMQRFPLFMYDRVNGDVELMFVSTAHLERSHLSINDRKGPCESVLVKVPRLTPERPFAMVLHENGDNFQMIAIDEAFMRRVKAMRFNKELLQKHLERGTRTKRTYRCRNSSVLQRVVTA